MDTPASAASPASPASPSVSADSHRAVEKLVLSYAELMDRGDFTGLGELLGDAVFIGSVQVSGKEAIEKAFRETLIVYDDGTPRTQHTTTNLLVEADEEEGTARSRAYFTALQAVPGLLPLQPIACGRYHDRFVLREGQWRFAERRVHVDLVGDVSRHLRRAS